jgi:hypothetical protein
MDIFILAPEISIFAEWSSLYAIREVAAENITH